MKRLLFKKEWLSNYNIVELNIDINWGHITIWDSYKITNKKHMLEIIDFIRNEFTLNESNFQLLCEWKTHNLLYDINFKRDKTKHVNFDNKNSFLLKILYVILSFLYIKS